jgi:hypothetical protein
MSFNKLQYLGTVDLHRIRNINTNVYLINHVSITVLTTGTGRRGRMVELFECARRYSEICFNRYAQKMYK